MAKRDLNIIVCVDPVRCLSLEYQGKNSETLLREIQEQVKDQGLEDRVQATPCRCIFGCTFGPRIDIINRAKRRLESLTICFPIQLNTA